MVPRGPMGTEVYPAHWCGGHDNIAFRDLILYIPRYALYSNSYRRVRHDIQRIVRCILGAYSLALPS